MKIYASARYNNICIFSPKQHKILLDGFFVLFRLFLFFFFGVVIDEGEFMGTSP